jgi:rhodanese-related sulfurtransferase/CBS domain-containing protein
MTSTVDLRQLDALVAQGAVIVDVLPESTYAEVHLPGAVNIPLTRMDERSTAALDRSKPVAVYCFDYQCDLSPRAAARLTQLGFTSVHDFVAGRAAWTSDGRPTEGTIGDRDRILPMVRADVPSCAPDVTVGDARKSIGEWELCVVIDADDIVLGIVRADALPGQPDDLVLDALLVPGPGTVRPDARVRGMAEQLRDDHLEHVLVTTFSGRLLGLLRRADLDVGR